VSDQMRVSVRAYAPLVWETIMQIESGVQPGLLSDKLQFVDPNRLRRQTEVCRTSFPLTIYKKESYHPLL